MKFKRLKITKRQCLNLLFITIVATILRMVLQAFIPASEASVLPPSIFVKAGLLPLVFTLFAMITYGSLAIVFFLIQDNLPGTKIKKGFAFGVAFCIMWFVFLFEPLPYVFDQSLMEFLSYPFVDGAVLLALGLLLGKFIATDNQEAKKVNLSNNLVIVTAVTLFFSVPRYINYSFFNEYSSFDAKPFLTMGWTIAGGMSIGIVYLLLRPGIMIQTNLLKALYFGIVVIGIDLFLFNGFIPLVFDQSFWGSFTRAMKDIVPITVGIYAAEVAISLYENKQREASILSETRSYN